MTLSSRRVLCGGVFAQPRVQTFGQFGKETRGVAKPLVFLAKRRQFFFQTEERAPAQAVTIWALAQLVERV